MTHRRMALGAAVALGAGLAAAASGAPTLPFHRVSVELGVRLVQTTPQLREALGVEGEHGALVLEVERGGAAERAGLRAGDVLTRVAGKPVGDAAAILDALENRRPGEEVDVEYVRGGHSESTRVTLARPGRPRMRVGPWSFPAPEFEPPAHAERDLRRFRDRVERQLRELEERLRRLEHDGTAQRTAVTVPASTPAASRAPSAV